jgi:putative FmdB family regulatory protein
MPTYEYSCKNCGPFEKLQGINDEKLAVCPECDGDVVRLIGAGCTPIFKGSGFYETDYKQKRR